MQRTHTPSHKSTSPSAPLPLLLPSLILSSRPIILFPACISQREWLTVIPLTLTHWQLQLSLFGMWSDWGVLELCVWGSTEVMVKEGQTMLGLTFLKDAWWTVWGSVSLPFAKKERGVQTAQFHTPTEYCNGILIYSRFTGYFNFLIIFWLSCSETRTSFIISSTSNLKR